jgi:calcineurin-like phosphoesterase family protein
MTKPGSSPIPISSTRTSAVIADRPDGWQDTIIENWNRLIQPEEIVFHVGDLTLGKRENIEDLAPLLNGELYLMRGNHDRRSNGFYQ